MGKNRHRDISITAAGKPLSIDRNKFVEHQMESVCDKKKQKMSEIS